MSFWKQPLKTIAKWLGITQKTRDRINKSWNQATRELEDAVKDLVKAEFANAGELFHYTIVSIITTFIETRKIDLKAQVDFIRTKEGAQLKALLKHVIGEGKEKLTEQILLTAITILSSAEQK